jgi:hypothetical protein
LYATGISDSSLNDASVRSGATSVSNAIVRTIVPVANGSCRKTFDRYESTQYNRGLRMNPSAGRPINWLRKNQAWQKKTAKAKTSKLQDFGKEEAAAKLTMQVGCKLFLKAQRVKERYNLRISSEAEVHRRTMNRRRQEEDRKNELGRNKNVVSARQLERLQTEKRHHLHKADSMRKERLERFAREATDKERERAQKDELTKLVQRALSVEATTAHEAEDRVQAEVDCTLAKFDAVLFAKQASLDAALAIIEMQQEFHLAFWEKKKHDIGKGFIKEAQDLAATQQRARDTGEAAIVDMGSFTQGAKYAVISAPGCPPPSANVTFKTGRAETAAASDALDAAKEKFDEAKETFDEATAAVSIPAGSDDSSHGGCRDAAEEKLLRARICQTLAKADVDEKTKAYEKTLKENVALIEARIVDDAFIAASDAVDAAKNKLNEASEALKTARPTAGPPEIQAAAKAKLEDAMAQRVVAKADLDGKQVAFAKAVDNNERSDPPGLTHPLQPGKQYCVARKHKIVGKEHAYKTFDGSEMRYAGVSEYAFWIAAISIRQAVAFVKLPRFSFACVWIPGIKGCCDAREVHEALAACYKGVPPLQPCCECRWFDKWIANVRKCRNDKQVLRFAFLPKPTYAAQPKFECTAEGYEGDYWVGMAQKIELEYVQNTLGWPITPIQADDEMLLGHLKFIHQTECLDMDKASLSALAGAPPGIEAKAWAREQLQREHTKQLVSLKESVDTALSRPSVHSKPRLSHPPGQQTKSKLLRARAVKAHTADWIQKQEDHKQQQQHKQQQHKQHKQHQHKQHQHQHQHLEEEEEEVEVEEEDHHHHQQHQQHHHHHHHHRKHQKKHQKKHRISLSSGIDCHGGQLGRRNHKKHPRSVVTKSKRSKNGRLEPLQKEDVTCKDHKVAMATGLARHWAKMFQTIVQSKVTLFDVGSITLRQTILKFKHDMEEMDAAHTRNRKRRWLRQLEDDHVDVEEDVLDGVMTKAEEGDIWGDRDVAIKAVVKTHGMKCWSLVAKHVSVDYAIRGLTGKQCRQRWQTDLDPAIEADAPVGTPPVKRRRSVFMVDPRRPAKISLSNGGRDETNHGHPQSDVRVKVCVEFDLPKHVPGADEEEAVDEYMIVCVPKQVVPSKDQTRKNTSLSLLGNTKQIKLSMGAVGKTVGAVVKMTRNLRCSHVTEHVCDVATHLKDKLNDGNTVRFEVYDLAPDTLYRFGVAAVDVGKRESALRMSEFAGFRTGGVPTPVHLQRLELGPCMATVYFKHSPNTVTPLVTAYQVSIVNEEPGHTQQEGDLRVRVVTADKSPITVEGLHADYKYTAKVVAINLVGQSMVSSGSQKGFHAGKPPEAPTDVRVEFSQGGHQGALVHFKPSLGGCEADMFVVKAQGVDRTWQSVPRASLQTTGGKKASSRALQHSPIPVNNLVVGKTYHFQVVGKNAFGESKSSLMIASLRTPSIPPRSIKPM